MSGYGFAVTLAAVLIVEAKERTASIYHNLYPEGLLYQLGVEGKSIADIAPHPLYLGIQAKYLRWILCNFKLPVKADSEE